MRDKVAILSAVAITILSATSIGAVPAFVPIQGYLSDDEGAAINGEITMKLSLYTELVGGSPVFEETHVTEVKDGQFAVYLGSVENLDLNLFRNNQSLFLGLKVGTDEEMSPRIVIGTSPYSGLAQYSEFAETAGDAQRLGGHPSDDFRLSSDPVSFGELTNVPSGLEDGDSDMLAGMSCTVGYVAKSTGSGWECSPDKTLSEDDVDVMVANNGFVEGTGNDRYLTRFTGTSNITNSVVYQSIDNKIGIGTTSPSYELDVYGNAHTSNNITVDGVIHTQEMFINGGTNFEGRISKNHTGGWPGVSVTSGPVLHFTFGTTDQSSDFRFFNGQTAQGPGEPIDWRLSMIIKESGNVGIGTSNPVRKLHITEAMRLEPSSSPPTNPSNGDLYFDSSGAFCAYVNGWHVIAGSGTCN